MAVHRQPLPLEITPSESLKDRVQDCSNQLKPIYSGVLLTENRDSWFKPGHFQLVLKVHSEWHTLIGYILLFLT